MTNTNTKMNKKIAVLEQMQIKFERAQGTSIKDLEAKYGISYNRIQAICKKTTDELIQAGEAEKAKEADAKVLQEQILQAMEKLEKPAAIDAEDGTVRGQEA